MLAGNIFVHRSLFVKLAKIFTRENFLLYGIGSTLNFLTSFAMAA